MRSQSMINPFSQRAGALIPCSSLERMSRIEMCVLRARPAAWIWVVLFAVGVAIPRLVVAQADSSERASRYLPVGHWAYEPIEYLRSRGFLANLNPLVQPYTRLQVARGLSEIDSDILAVPTAHWARLLRDELQRELDLLAGREVRGWGVRMTVGARTSTSQRLDVLRPIGAEGFWPRYTAGVWVESGPLAIETRLQGDLYLFDDPDGLDPEQRLGGRTDNAYVAVQLPFGQVMIGRLRRNWSALGTRSLMVSNNPFPYPQVGFTVNLDRFSLRAFTGELDTVTDTVAGAVETETPYKRYIAAQRVDYSTERFGVSLGQAILYASRTGGPLLRFLNPVELLAFLSDDQPRDVVVNLVLQAQVWYQADGLVLFAEALLDDIDIDPEDANNPQNPVRAPARYAVAFGGRLNGLADWLEVGASYERVSAFAYRTFEPAVDRYSFLRRGLGANFSDYDRLPTRRRPADRPGPGDAACVWAQAGWVRSPRLAAKTRYASSPARTESGDH